MPKANRNEEFATWWTHWISRIQRNRAIENQSQQKDIIRGKQERPTENDSEDRNSHFPCYPDGDSDVSAAE